MKNETDALKISNQGQGCTNVMWDDILNENDLTKIEEAEILKHRKEHRRCC